MNDSQKKDNSTITYSIVIGRVSTEDDERILETLESLNHQQENPSLEILLADRISDHVSQRIMSDYPETKIIECPPGTDLPTMRTMAARQALGEFVLVTEDHCVPPRDWLKQFARAFAAHPEASAIGGSVVNGVTDTGLDWATFLCEYAPMSPPIQSGPTPNLAGMNVAYRREIFREVDEQVLTSGFWETTLHPVLHERGHILIADDNVRIYHCKKFSLRLFLRQRFVYSRYYAGIRFTPDQKAKRLIYAMASVVLPPLLTFRFFQNARHKASVRSHLGKAAPYLVLFYLIWGVGEAWGYLFGPRDALQEIE